MLPCCFQGFLASTTHTGEKYGKSLVFMSMWIRHGYSMLWIPSGIQKWLYLKCFLVTDWPQDICQSVDQKASYTFASKLYLRSSLYFNIRSVRECGQYNQELQPRACKTSNNYIHDDQRSVSILKIYKMSSASISSISPSFTPLQKNIFLDYIPFN